MLQFVVITAAAMAINFAANVKEEYDQLMSRAPEDEDETQPQQ